MQTGSVKQLKLSGFKPGAIEPRKTIRSLLCMVSVCAAT